jgi:hypothetical protein
MLPNLVYDSMSTFDQLCFGLFETYKKLKEIIVGADTKSQKLFH